MSASSEDSKKIPSSLKSQGASEVNAQTFSGLPVRLGNHSSGARTNTEGVVCNVTGVRGISHSLSPSLTCGGLHGSGIFTR